MNLGSGLFILEESGTNFVIDIELTIYDALGRKLFDQSALLEGMMKIDLTEFPSGC